MGDSGKVVYFTCPECGSKIERGSNQCAGCGVEIEWDDTESGDIVDEILDQIGRDSDSRPERDEGTPKTDDGASEEVQTETSPEVRDEEGEEAPKDEDETKEPTSPEQLVYKEDDLDVKVEGELEPEDELGSTDEEEEDRGEPQEKEPGEVGEEVPEDEEPGEVGEEAPEDEEPGEVDDEAPEDEEPGEMGDEAPEDEEPLDVEEVKPKKLYANTFSVLGVLSVALAVGSILALVVFFNWDVWIKGDADTVIGDLQMTAMLVTVLGLIVFSSITVYDAFRNRASRTSEQTV